jgi:hypothetical protein
MARPKGSKNRRTMLREAEEAMGRPEEFVDSLQVLEHTMRHFYGAGSACSSKSTVSLSKLMPI